MNSHPTAFDVDLRPFLGLREETPAVVYAPVRDLYFSRGQLELARIRAVARDAGAAGWLQHGVTLGGLVTRFDGMRRRGAFSVSADRLRGGVRVVSQAAD